MKRILLITDSLGAYQERPSSFACLAKLHGGKFKLIVSERSTTQTVTWREKVRFFLYRWAEENMSKS